MTDAAEPEAAAEPASVGGETQPSAPGSKPAEREAKLAGEGSKLAEGEGKSLSDRLIRAGQVAGAITAIVTVSLLAWNALKPAPAPAVLEGTVSNVDAHYGESEFSYLESNPAKLVEARDLYRQAGLDEAEADDELREPGILVEYTIQIQGPPGLEVTLLCTLRDAATDAKIPEGNAVGFGTKRYVFRAGKYKTTHSGWIAPPASGGSYRVEIDLVAKNGETLDTRKSRVFRVPRGKRA
ncbi:MAG TPA: hypothetical protein VMG62_02480 [Solirubrobacteraceae bacterium]|nr:hypothetical protein [Solirubrobacteraceae bacterium]